MEDLLREFLSETHESLDLVDVELVRFEKEPSNAELLSNIFRLVHTIKGTCGFLGLGRLEALAHSAETLMGQFREGRPVTTEAVSLILASIDRIKEILAALERSGAEPEGSDDDLIQSLDHLALGESSVPEAGAETEAGETADERRSGGERRDTGQDGGVKTQSIRVQVDTLEHLMTMVSELVLTRNQLLALVRKHEDSEFKGPLQRLSNVTAELQEGVMKSRMQPVGNAWAKLPRLVRDLASELGKDIRLERHGADTELDRQVLELIRDPIIHMVRNSADHGIETPAERRRVGKPERGLIRLKALHEGGQIVIQISDDGRGLDPAKIRAKAVQLGLVAEAEAEKLTEQQVQRFIFSPGFSTAASVTSVSGRGVGMDVVKNNIDQIGGTIDLKAVPGRGTTFTIKIPLTLAIVSALIIEVAKERFAIPQLAVAELVRITANSEHKIERINDAPVMRLRNKLLPLLHLGSHLRLVEGGAHESGFVVVMQVGECAFGIIVDGVFHTEEIVVKPVSSKLRHLHMFSGNTILGDGSVIMIIDPNGLAAAIGTRLEGSDLTDGTTPQDAETAPGAERPISLLVFRAGTQELKAVPLSLVTRLEEVDAKSIEFADGRHVVQYRGSLMPLVPINEHVAVRTSGKQPLLVFMDSGRSMGLVVDEVVDILDDRLDIHIGSRTAGVLGTAIIKGRATEILDVGHYLPLAYEDWLRRKDLETTALACRLLLVDDSAFFRNMLTPVLNAAGFEVTAVASGQEALDLVAGGGFDLIVSDIEMPGMSGFELAQALRKLGSKAEHVPLIALSSHTAPEIIERGRQAGFDHFVAKFDRRGLIAALTKAQPEWARAA